MPKFLAHKIYDAGSQKTGKTSAFLFGARLSLPCGFTQALQLYVCTRRFHDRSFNHAYFSIGTLPSLAGIGVFSSFAKGSFKQYFTTFAAVLVIFLGVINFAPGYNLLEQ